jgi:RND family efflux transporter MFP subunit
VSATPTTPDGRRLAVLSVASVLVAALAVLGLVARRGGAEAREADLRQKLAAEGVPVRTATVEMGSPTRPVAATGEVHAFRQATLYAKVSGYVTSMRVDKGDRVRQGEVLALLEAPAVEQQVASARADLILKEQEARRVEALEPSHVVSEQDVEQAVSARRVAEAALERARALLSYATLRAPFTGRVTARYVDEGALVAAATGSTSSVQPILDVAEMDRVRVFAYLPQDDALEVREGDEAELSLPHGEVLRAPVARLARSLDPRTRTMLVEIDVPNDPPAVYPGQFVPVRILVHRPPHPAIPTAALVFRGDSPQVALVEGHRVHFVPVVLGHDDGPRVEVLRGLAGGELLALDASSLSEGAPVQASPPAR